MSLAEKALERMQALNVSIAQAHNDIAKLHKTPWGEKRRCDIDSVDGIYKFYRFPDGSKIGARIREAEHSPRWPKDLQQVWLCA